MNEKLNAANSNRKVFERQSTHGKSEVRVKLATVRLTFTPTTYVQEIFGSVT